MSGTGSHACGQVRETGNPAIGVEVGRMNICEPIPIESPHQGSGENANRFLRDAPIVDRPRQQACRYRPC